MTTLVATAVPPQAAVPNVSDIVWKDGFIWAVFEGQTMYRINPVSGAVSSFPLAGLGMANDPYGAQWVYGNGNIGVSNNVTGRVYQIAVANPTSATPTFTLVSSIPGPASSNNDGTSYPGAPVNLRVVKDAPATFVPGGTVAYSMTVVNDGPGVSSGWVLNDATPAALVNPTTTSPGCAIVNGAMSCAGGPLGVGEAVTVSFSGTTAATQADRITNTVTVVGNETDPTPADDTDDATTCPSTTGVPSFAVQKTTSSAVVHAGDTVTYRITVMNTGSVEFTDATPASFADDLSDVLDDAVLGAVTGGATVSGTTLRWQGPLAVGEAVVINYQVTVKGEGRGDSTLTNVVVPGQDGECAVAEQCTTTVLVAAYTVTKVALTEPPVVPGQRVDYRITVENTGGYAFTAQAPASFTDDLTDDLDDAVLDESSITGGATYAQPLLSWSGALGIGSTVTIDYTVTVADPDTGDHSLVNTVVTPPGSGGGCPEGTGDPVCTTIVPVRAYTVAKAVTVEGTDPVTLRYTITVTNVGQADYTDAQPASFTDDLTRVLDDATYDGDAAAGATFAAPNLTWSGALAVGESTTVTYSVTANSPVTGDGRLRNTVLPDAESGGSCASATACATDTPIPGTDPGPGPDPNPGPDPGPGPGPAPDGSGPTGAMHGLALTGSSVLDLLLAAVAMIGAGVLLCVRRRRRPAQAL
ncbi:MAG: hypothetical protein WBA97_20290 [Actinophytocola sp.]